MERLQGVHDALEAAVAKGNLMAKVFLDVGGHRGESSLAAAKYDFDIIHLFEPSPKTHAALTDLDPRVQVHQFGLWKADVEAPLYHGPGTQSSSLYSDKRNVDPTVSDVVQLRRASEWLRENTAREDFIVMKVNVEGAEMEIFRDLEDGGLLDRISVAVVYPDYRKIESIKETGFAFMKGICERHSQVRASNDTFDPAIFDIEERTTDWLGKVEGLIRLR